MQWQAFGFKNDPLGTAPITKETLDLFTGHDKEVKLCSNVLTGSNVRVVVEGARGVGTTSFANYLRFTAESKKIYFTPRTETKVGQGWRLETLLAAMISNLVREIELVSGNKKLTEDKRFQAAKALSSRIAESYRSFGVEAFGFGANYGRQAGVATQPVIVPSPTLGHHIEDLIALLRSVGYKQGVLFQLNNLDIGEIHSQKEMKYLFNELRDYTQIDGSNWIFVGDKGLRRFIAQQVDRLDDIISYEAKINPLPMKDFLKMLEKRVSFYRQTKNVELPIEQDVFKYLYNITNGRLRYIFGLVSRLMNRLYVGDLTDKITLDIAKPMLVSLGKDRMLRADITRAEEQVLRLLVTLEDATPSNIAKQLKKTSQYVGRVLSNIVKKGLASSQKEGRDRKYTPSIDAIIAYAE